MLTDNDKGDFPLCGLVLDISNLSRFQGVANFKLPATLVAKTASGFVALLATASFATLWQAFSPQQGRLWLWGFQVGLSAT